MTAILLIELIMIVIIFALWMLSVNDGPGKPFLIAWGLIVIAFVYWEYSTYGKIPVVGMGTELDNYGVMEIFKAFAEGMYNLYTTVIGKFTTWMNS